MLTFNNNGSFQRVFIVLLYRGSLPTVVIVSGRVLDSAEHRSVRPMTDGDIHINIRR